MTCNQWLLAIGNRDREMTRRTVGVGISGGTRNVGRADREGTARRWSTHNYRSRTIIRCRVFITYDCTALPRIVIDRCWNRCMRNGLLRISNRDSKLAGIIWRDAVGSDASHSSRPDREHRVRSRRTGHRSLRTSVRVNRCSIGHLRSAYVDVIVHRNISWACR